MAVKFLRINVFGDDVMRRKLFRGQQRVINMKGPLDEVADNMMENIGATFDSEGRRGGGSWAFLKPETIRRRLKAGYPADPILYVTGDLRRSMTVRGDANQNLRVTNQMIWLSSELDYAERHQFGDDRMPARPFVKILPIDRERWVKICEAAIMEALR